MAWHRVAPWLVFMACGCDDAVEVATTRYEDVGGVCFSPRAEGGSHIQVILDACESSCADVRATCDASVVDGSIVVHAEAVATRELNGIPCPDECQPVEARCTLPELTAGYHEVLYGQRSTGVVLPISEPRTEIIGAPNLNVCRFVDTLE
jgi:hypothetical protein